MLLNGLLDYAWWGLVLITLASRISRLRRSPSTCINQAHPALTSPVMSHSSASGCGSHRHGDQGMDRDPSQAPRQVRDRGRPRTVRRCTGHQPRALDRRLLYVKNRTIPKPWSATARHARRLGRAACLREPLGARPVVMGAVNIGAVRPDSGHDHLRPRRKILSGIGPFW